MIITEMFWNPNGGQGYQDLWNAHTSGFGDAIRSCLDAQSNVSFQIGMVGDLFENLKSGLANATFGTAEGAQAAWIWYHSYSEAEKMATSGVPGRQKKRPSRPEVALR